MIQLFVDIFKKRQFLLAPHLLQSRHRHFSVSSGYLINNTLLFETISFGEFLLQRVHRIGNMAVELKRHSFSRSIGGIFDEFERVKPHVMVGFVLLMGCAFFGLVPGIGLGESCLRNH